MTTQTTPKDVGKPNHDIDKPDHNSSDESSDFENYMPSSVILPYQYEPEADIEDSNSSVNSVEEESRLLSTKCENKAL